MNLIIPVVNMFSNVFQGLYFAKENILALLIQICLMKINTFCKNYTSAQLV